MNNQTSANLNPLYTTFNDFSDWIGGCLGFRQESYDYQYQYQYPSNSTTQPPVYAPPQQPYQPQNPNQGYPYGFGRGCWGW